MSYSERDVEQSPKSERGNVIESANAQLEQLIKRLRGVDHSAGRLMDSITGPIPAGAETAKVNAVSQTTQDFLRELDNAVSRLETTINRAY